MLLLLSMCWSAIAGAVVAMCVLLMPPEEDKYGRRLSVSVATVVIVLTIVLFVQASKSLVQVY